jgi:hypothetical protein
MMMNWRIKLRKLVNGCLVRDNELSIWNYELVFVAQGLYMLEFIKYIGLHFNKLDVY